MIQLIRWFAFQGFKLIHRLKTGGKGKLERNACRETSVNESFTNHQPLPIKQNVRPLCPTQPCRNRCSKQNQCSSSWYRRTSLDHATNYHIGRAKQNAKEVWAHRKPLLGNLINCYLARTVPVPRNMEIEHCSHLPSYLFVYVFFLTFSYFCNSAWPLYWLYISETRQWLVSRFILFFGEGGGGCHCCITAYVFSSCIRRFPDDSVSKIQNTESDLYCWFSHDVTLCSGTKKPVNWLVKKQPGAPNENIAQNHLNIALLNVF